MRRSPLAALLLASTALIHGAAAQQAPQPQTTSQRVLTATIAERFEYDSNYRLDEHTAGPTYFADTIFALDYLQETESRSLGLGLDVGMRALWEADQSYDTQVASPSGGYLTFVDEGPHLAFDADLRARTRKVNTGDQGNDPIDEGLDSGDDLGRLDDTRETRYDANIGLVLGPDAPMSYGLRFIGSKIDYENEDNLTPRSTVEGEAFWSARINPVLSAGIFGSYLHYSADNNADTDVNVAEGDIGIIYEPSEVLKFDAGIGYADRRKHENDRTVQSDSGVVLRGNARYILPDFTLNADGRFTTAAPDPRVSLNIRADYALQRGRIFARAYNRFAGASSGGANELRITGGVIGIEHDINSLSSVRFDVGYAHQHNLDNDDDDDIDRTNITASYLHDLTETVTAEVGYGYTLRSDGPEDAKSHRVFMEIGKTFVTGL